MPTASLTLPLVLDLKAAEPLKASLLEHRGEDLRIDASDVERLGALCLQLLVAARRAWFEDGHAFDVEPRSDAFNQAITLFGAECRLPSAGAHGETL